MSPPGEQAPLPKVALVGHPNVGKTTLFNALTGKNRRVGNYPGVTVERTSATLRTPHGHQLELIDLPGAYSLSPNSPDETVTRDILLGDLDDEPAPDLVICVVDAASLERHLYFVLQVIDTGIPVVLALNQVDRVEEKGLRINRQVPDRLVARRRGRGGRRAGEGNRTLVIGLGSQRSTIELHPHAADTSNHSCRHWDYYLSVASFVQSTSPFHGACFFVLPQVWYNRS